MSELVERAKAFATRVHEGQTRLDKDKMPLVIHLEEVVSLVRESGGSDEELAAAWLHDVVEDTSVSIEEVADKFGNTVGGIVSGLTDLPEFNGLPTLERKIRQAQRVSSLSDSVKRVKMADQISNVRSVATSPPVCWNTQKRLDYVEGAMSIVFECESVSEFLFDKFCEAFWTARKVNNKK